MGRLLYLKREGMKERKGKRVIGLPSLKYSHAQNLEDNFASQKPAKTINNPKAGHVGKKPST